MTERIIRVERGETSKKEPMWICRTASNKKLNIFAKQSKMLSDYPEVLELPMGGTLHWRSFPLIAETFVSGEWENVDRIAPRPDGACPDQPLTPDHALSYARAIRWAKFVTNPKLNVVTWDTETTGLDATMDEVISIGIVDCDGQVLLDTLIKPSNMAVLTATNASEINGITADMLEDAPTFPELYGELKAFLDGRFWLGYNISFDAKMLDATCLRYGLPPLMSVGMHDATPFVADFVGQWDESKGGYKYWKLVEAAERFGLTEFDAHHAAADAVATREIVKRMSERGAE